MDNQVVRRPRLDCGSIVGFFFVILVSIVTAYLFERNVKKKTIGEWDQLVLYVTHLVIGILVFYAFSHKSDACYLVENRFVRKNLNYEDIIGDSCLYLAPNDRHFPNPVLVYISPNCPREVELALKFTSKFTHISPEGYTLTSDGKKIRLEGRNNYNKDWIKKLTKEARVMVLPRVVTEVSSHTLLEDQKHRNSAINLIVNECREKSYQGVVLEYWSRWEEAGILNDPTFRQTAIAFIRDLGVRLHKMSRALILIIHPPPSGNWLGGAHFELADVKNLSKYVDGYSLVMHAFSGVGSPGPNAPLNWIKRTLDMFLSAPHGDKDLARKLFIGLSFNGYDHLLAGGGLGDAIITSDRYKEVVKLHEPQMGWDERTAEHHFIYMDGQDQTHAVFFPSLQSVWMRLEEARVRGSGVAIHQLGAGFDSFLGLL